MQNDKNIVDRKPEIVVSLTSFPAAIEYSVTAIKSVLNGNVLPDRLVLYLNFNEFGEDGIPDYLTRLSEENPIFEVRDFPLNLRSYTKLIPALADFPDAVIVTVDDDIDYHPDMLKQLLEYHQMYPDNIIAHRAKKIKLDAPYKKWTKFRWYDFLLKRIHDKDNLILQTGVGGVLYPPHSLREDMLDPKVFTKLAPTTDDIWFWAAAIANGRTVLPIPFGKNKPKEFGKPKEISLKSFNYKSGDDNNYKSFKRILEYYPFLEEVIR